MKTPKKVLTLVLAALAGGVVGFALAKNEARANLREKVTTTAEAEVPQPRTPLVSEQRNRPSIDWPTVAQSDLGSAAELLRRAGVPEDVVHDVIKGRVERETLARWAAELRSAEPLAYWKIAGTSRSKLVMELELFLAHPIRREVLAQLGRALGQNPLHESALEARRALLEYKYAFLPADRADAVEKAIQDWHDRMATLTMSYPPDPAEIAAADKLRAEFDEQVAGLLTPEEKYAYDLRFSSSAARLRQDLERFAPGEQEFQRLYAIHSEYERQMMRLQAEAAQPAEKSERLQQAREKLEQDLTAALGPNRFEAYVRARDPYYQTLSRFTERHEIAAAVADEVYAMRKGIPEQIIAFLGTDTLPGHQKAEAMAAFKEQLADRLKKLLGPTTFAEFRRHPAGAWVEQIYLSRGNPPSSGGTPE